jgi:DNA polymerase V
MIKTKEQDIYTPDLSTRCQQSLFDGLVPAGFPSPATDYEENKLDLNRHLIRNSAATFFVRAAGDSMIGAGIHTGDLLIVDRSLEPKDKNVVIAVVNGELTVKRIRIQKKKIALEPENENYPVRQIEADTEFEVWGVVTNVVHAL